MYDTEPLKSNLCTVVCESTRFYHHEPEGRHALRPNAVRCRFLNSSKLFDCLLDRVKFFNERIHRMFAVVELLSENENLRRALSGNDDHPILAGHHDAVRSNPNPIAIDRNIHPTKTIMPD